MIFIDQSEATGAWYSAQFQQQYVFFKRVAILDLKCHEQAMIRIDNILMMTTERTNIPENLDWGLCHPGSCKVTPSFEPNHLSIFYLSMGLISFTWISHVIVSQCC